MKFKDEKIVQFNLKNVDDICRMIIEYLCGEKYRKVLEKREKELLSNLITKWEQEALDYAQFNEFLLLLDMDRVSKAFFNFFFEKEKISLEDLKEGIVKFRAFAMLCFGNFRFAYKELITKDEKELSKSLHPYCNNSEEVLKIFEQRPSVALEINIIERDKTWYNGYISKQKFEKEKKVLQEKGKKYLQEENLLKVLEKYKEIGNDINEVENKALSNTDIYLTWDYMDVYVATSMRNKWEFEEAFDFVNRVFNDKRLKGLRLRYFDPTQSQCNNRIDKGLLEGLMLKRSKCTIYMAQEVDSMGKDSELAATLAQRKPVIAYVPRIDDKKKHSEKIKKYPLEFFEKRFFILRAEEIFKREEVIEALSAYNNFEEIITDFLNELSEYRQNQPFTLWEEKEQEFKDNYKKFSDICNILATVEYYYFEKRANTIKSSHPLSIQVHLDSGVANGVLVVRTSEECIELLYKILTNAVEFTLKYNEDMTILEENISKCPFRVVTNYEKLTNSFWNFYLISE